MTPGPHRMVKLSHRPRGGDRDVGPTRESGRKYGKRAIYSAMKRSSRMSATMRIRWFTRGMVVALLATAGMAADRPTPTGAQAGPKPTLADVAYGEHPQKVLDLYQVVP